MRYYATASGSSVCRAIDRGDLGQIVRLGAGNVVRTADAIADNGLFGVGIYPGDKEYLRWLAKRPTVHWAVAPDVVADHHATLERSWPMLRPIRETVGGVALCAQNGAHPDDMPWDYIDAVFLAGILECTRCRWVPQLDQLAHLPKKHPLCLACMGPMQEWKEGPVAAAIAAEANRRGKWVHMGRVNTLARLRIAQRMGCRSGDGTTFKYGPDVNLKSMLAWLRMVNHPQLFDLAVPA